MTEKTQEMWGITFAGAITVNGPMFDIHDNEHVHIHANGRENETPLTASDKDIKAAIEELLDATDEKGEFVFKNKKQWWAVYRVLTEFCNYPIKKTAFESKMKELGVAKVDGDRDLTYESLKKASNEVSKMSCSPDSWNTVKDINDNNKQQYVVAEFLMLKLGIKS